MDTETPDQDYSSFTKEDWKQWKRQYHHHYHGGGLGAYILIAIGAILLLNNFRILPWYIWNYLWQFWPILLILWGLRILLGRNIISNTLISLISLVVVVLIVFYATSLVDPSFSQWLRHYLHWWQTYPINPSTQFTP